MEQPEPRARGRPARPAGSLVASVVRRRGPVTDGLGRSPPLRVELMALTSGSL